MMLTLNEDSEYLGASSFLNSFAPLFSARLTGSSLRINSRKHWRGSAGAAAARTFSSAAGLQLAAHGARHRLAGGLGARASAVGCLAGGSGSQRQRHDAEKLEHRGVVDSSSNVAEHALLFSTFPLLPGVSPWYRSHAAAAVCGMTQHLVYNLQSRASPQSLASAAQISAKISLRPGSAEMRSITSS